MGMSRPGACCIAADMHSAGVLLAEVATGMVPFHGDVPEQTDEDQHVNSVLQQANRQAWVSSCNALPFSARSNSVQLMFVETLS